MADIDSGSGSPVPRKRADARRNEETLLDAAAAAFVTSGVDVPVRDIAGKAGVGVGTIYRHFPTRADLIVAVYRHQVEACAEAGPALLANSSTPHAALASWINLFVNFLITKHGLARALQSDKAAFETLHAYFLDRLVPVCAQLLDAAATAGEILPDMDAYELLLGVGNLCIGADNNPRYDARRMVELVIAGLRVARYRREVSSVTMSATGCGCPPATPCPAHSRAPRCPRSSRPSGWRLARANDGLAGGEVRDHVADLRRCASGGWPAACHASVVELRSARWEVGPPDRVQGWRTAANPSRLRNQRAPVARLDRHLLGQQEPRAKRRSLGSEGQYRGDSACVSRSRSAGR